jgi:hypothetical protein
MTLLVHATQADTLIDLARRYAENPQLWPVQPRYDPDGRWYTRLARTDTYEAWLLAWLPGQHTGWHDHGGSSGVFVVVSGALREDTMEGTRHLSARTGRQFGARHVHCVTNDAAAPAVSVHVYAPILSTMTRYDLIAGALRVRDVERAGADW